MHVIYMSVRTRLKCASPRCAQATFSEQIPGLTTPSGRRTPPLNSALAEVALALAGRPGSRLAAKLAMPCCRDVLIRLIRAQPSPGPGTVWLTCPSPQVTGYSDFWHPTGFTSTDTTTLAASSTSTGMRPYLHG